MSLLKVGEEGPGWLTDELARRAVGHGMQQPHHAARVAYSLPPPHDGLALALALVLVGDGVLGHAVALVRGANGEDEQQREGGPRDKGQQVRVRQGVDVVQGEGGGHAEAVRQRRHELRVGLEGDEGRGALVRVRVDCR